MGPHRIPSRESGESLGVATQIQARRDVVQAPDAEAIQPGIEEAQRLPAVPKQVDIQQRVHTRKGLCVVDQLDGRLRDEGRRKGPMGVAQLVPE